MYWQPHGFLYDNNSLLGGIVGAVLTAGLLWLKEELSKPRLKLNFENNSAYLTTSTHEENKQTVTRKYLRVSFQAAGRFGSSPAKQCRVYLTSIQQVTGNKLGPDLLYDARQISWPPHEKFDALDIPRGLKVFANVVTMRIGQPEWCFQVSHPYGLHNVVNHPGKLRIGLTATADNATPVSIYIRASILTDASNFDATLE